MIRTAVLGAGRIGQVHASAVAASRLAQLVVVVDPFEEAAKSLAERIGCEAATDPLEVIARDDIDAVIIGTPTDTHVHLMLKAVEAGKAVLCEKPVDLDIAKVDEALRQLEDKDVPVMLAFNRRFDPSAAAMRQAIDAGEIGNVHQVVITSRDPGMPPEGYVQASGGIFRDMTIHDFDMARWLLGEEPTEVLATASRLVSPDLVEKYDDYDTVMVVMRTASGKQCHINNSRKAVYGYDQRMEVFGSNGMLLNDNLRPSTLRRYNQDQTEVHDPLLNFFLERYDDAFRAELEAFFGAVGSGKPVPVTPYDGRQALHLANCALESVRTGKVVKV